MRKRLVAVTIPVYKKKPDSNELKSLNQCLSILGKHTIVFFVPSSLDVSFYRQVCEGKTDFRVERFADEYFAGIDGYNKLMLSKDFYRRLSDYKFILIY